MIETTTQSETTCLNQSQPTEDMKESVITSIQHPSLLTAVMAYRHPRLIERVVEKEGLSNDAAHSLMEDMLRFLYLCGTKKGRFGPPEKIDVAWHHFILFTKDYADFCHRFFGRFIHHSPITTKGRLPPGESSTVKRTYDAATETFGDLSSNWVYPMGAQCFDSCDTPSTNCQN